MSELKACPFCGSSANPTMNWDGTADYSLCRCSNRDCPAELDYEFMLAEIWNTRPTEDELRARVAELEAFIEQLIERGDDLVLLAYDREYPDVIEWQNLVTEWKVQR